MIQLYPVKAFFKVVSEDQDVKEIDYIKVDNEGNLFLEKHMKDGNIKKQKLVEDVHELC